MAKLGNLYLDGKFPISTNRLNHFDRLFGQALFGGVEKSVDYAPIISINDALAKPAIDLQCKITAVQEGSGDPSPDNIRPFIGFSGLSVFRKGKNLAEINRSSGSGNQVTFTVDRQNWTVTTSGTATGGDVSFYLTTEYFLLKKGTYTLTGCPEGGWTSSYFMLINQVGSSSIDTGNGATFTTNTDMNVQIRIGIRNGVNVDGLVFKPMLRVAGTSGDYESYKSMEIPVTWQDTAGTIYGGIIDIITGLLIATHAIYTITNDTRFGSFTISAEYGSWAPITSIADMKLDSDKILAISDSAVGVTYADRIKNPNVCRVYSDWISRGIVIRSRASDNITTLEELKTLFMGANIVYELATPITYQLTPQQVMMLAGSNTIWNTAGDIKLTYLAKKS